MMIPKVLTYENIGYCDGEILRYAGAKGSSDELLEVVEDCKREVEGKLDFKVCYLVVPVEIRESEIDFGFSKVNSRFLAKNLDGCTKVLLLTATVGVEMDRLIWKTGVKSEAHALMMHALGVERVESLVERFLFDYERESGESLRARFSPGYGDLELSFQKDLLGVLNATKLVGVSLNESLIMSPSKSVSAIVGVGEKVKEKGCKSCEKKDCQFRR